MEEESPLHRLRVLRDEMVSRGWVITCFQFTYKRKQYFVLVHRYLPPRQAPKYALVELTFVDAGDVSRTLSGAANTRRIDIKARELREFFGIEWAENLDDLMAQFYKHLGRFIPADLPADLEPDEIAMVLRQLGTSDSEDPNKVYCVDVRRNGPRADGSTSRRSAYNSQKTQMLRPALYAQLKDDTNLSFIYSIDPDQEQTDTDVLARFARRQRNP